ncbi:ER membrane protein complex subunit 6 [Pelomyxa schiedti]|nr:ER membrane protein complex subunit 6 [Pelomyxa schiedti]
MNTLDEEAPDRIAHNEGILYFCRVFISCLSGCAAGILGLKSLWGFAGFVVSSLITTVLILILGTTPQTAHGKYFKSSVTPWSHSLMQGAMTYVLFWTLLFDMVHVYS